MSRKGLILLMLVLILGSCGTEGSRDCKFDFTTGLDKVASGVWKAEIGKPDKVNLLSELDFTPKIDAINNLEEADLPVDKAEITAEVFDGKTYIRFPLDKEEKIYGLGLNFQSVQQRGRIARLHVDHYGGSDNGRTHAPVPFFVSSKGYGVLINAARYIDVYAGTSVRKDTKNPPVLYNRNTDNDWCLRRVWSWCFSPGKACSMWFAVSIFTMAAEFCLQGGVLVSGTGFRPFLAKRR